MFKRIGLLLVMMFALAINVMAEEITETPATIAQRYTNPGEISSYLATYYTYISDTAQFDRPEYFQTTEEMIRNKKGDCEDFAVLTQAILKELGIESQLIGVFWLERDMTGTYKWSGHAICVWQEEDESFSFMSNQIWVPAMKDTLEELLDAYVSIYWYEYTVFLPDGSVIARVKNEFFVEPKEDASVTMDGAYEIFE